MEHHTSVVASLLLLVAGCDSPVQRTPANPSPVHLTNAQVELVKEMGFPGVVPADPTNRSADNLAAAQLGQFLFFDPKLSKGGEISCATCHDPARAFTDGLPLNRGISQGVRNTLSILDSAHQQWFNWDGQFDSLWSQPHGPMLHPREMGSSFEHVIERVRGESILRTQYEQVFGLMPSSPLSTAQSETVVSNIGKAIAAYERRLVTGPSLFDRWVERWRAAGTPRALALVAPEEFSIEAQRGLDTFTSRAECWQCHIGPLLSDGEFHALGAAPRNDLIADSARFGAVAKLQSSAFRSTGLYSDAPESEQAKIVEALVARPDQWGAFRTPSLRNVTKTAPYFHQGQFATLEEVLHFYSTLEGAVTMDHHRESVLRKTNLTTEEITALLAFLRSLDGAPPPTQWTVDPWIGSKVSPKTSN